MKSSVIITTYKRSSFLYRAIESVLQQSFPLEVVVVDDNGMGTPSQIETQNVLEKYKDKLIYIPLEKNSGACIARNVGVSKASGEYIFFLDDDDEFLSCKVEVQTKFLDANLDFDGCLSAFTRIEELSGREIFAESNFPLVGDFNNFAIRGNFFTPMLSIRKSSFEKIGGFKEIPRFQDRYFMLHCLCKNMKFAEISKPLYIMYEHTEERITHKNVENSIISLNIIREFIEENRMRFKNGDFKKFIHKDYRMRATIYYVSKKNRIKSAYYWLRTAINSQSNKDFLMVIKSFLS